MNSIHVVFAEADHAKFAEEICRLIYESALQRGTGIAKRSPEYIASKIRGGKAVVALDGGRLVGFSYIECWEHGDYVATSGLIVTVPACQNLQYHHIASGHEAQLPFGVCACDLLGIDR